MRDTSQQWYESFISYQSKRFGKDGNTPTKADMQNAHRTSKRTVWDNFNVRHEVDELDPYNREMLVDYYEAHNRMVIDYFRFKDNLLVLNLSGLFLQV